MKKLILIILVLISNSIYSQKGYEDWDKNYRIENPENIIQNELNYAEKVENKEIEGSYYVAMEKFRFIALFTGNKRNINAEVYNSMRRVFKLKTGKSDVLNGLVTKEFEFIIGKSKIWMPIQNQLIEPFQSEVSKGSKVLLYCLFTNEHKFEGGIINAFFISEFTSEWE